ncbi:MAG: hypothetical protein KY451_04275 [Actinobacteria bacterium]|nr:hypothetical protein [Actinomycetota bacterium]
MSGDSLDRRTLLRLAGASLLVAGCRTTVDDPTVEVPVVSPPPPSPARVEVSPSPAGLPPAQRYVPLAGERLPQCKQVAADFMQALATRTRGQQPADVMAAAAAFTGTGFRPDPAMLIAAPLYTEPLSAGDIVYPQFAGLLPLSPGARRAAMMVVVRQRSLTGGDTSTQTVRICDVRLEVQQNLWRVVELVSIGGEPVGRPPGLDPRAARVLDDPRIELPDTARWDVHAGRISLDLLDVLAVAAAAAPVAVTVLRSGHPPNVFATPKISNHTQGRAVDLWRVDGQPVVTTGAAAGSARALLAAVAADRRLLQAGSPEGSDLDGAGRRSFTDLVHSDHLHLAVGGPSAPA